MKVGDLVRWIGFPGADAKGVRATGPNSIGIIVQVYNVSNQLGRAHRVDVMWADGSKGDKLYPQTVEVVCYKTEQCVL